MSEEEHPYSLAYESNGIVYVSGAASIDYTTHQPVPGRREALDAALAAVETRLSGVGLGIENIVKMTYFLTDLSLRRGQRAGGRAIQPASAGPNRRSSGGHSLRRHGRHRGDRPSLTACPTSPGWFTLTGL